MSDLSEPATPAAPPPARGGVPWFWVLPALALVLAFHYVAVGRRRLVRVHRLERHQRAREVDRARQLPRDLPRPRRRAARSCTRSSSRSPSSSSANVIGLCARARAEPDASSRATPARALLRAGRAEPARDLPTSGSSSSTTTARSTGSSARSASTSLAARVARRPDVGALDDLRRDGLAVRRARDGRSTSPGCRGSPRSSTRRPPSTARRSGSGFRAVTLPLLAPAMTVSVDADARSSACASSTR